MPEVCEYIDPLVHDSREDAADVPTDHEGTFGLVVKRELATLAPADSTGGWPTFTFFVKVGTHTASGRSFILISPH